MGKGKPMTVEDIMSKKFMYGPKPEPVWVYLEREMRANASKKPYNEKVGAWLKFLKKLRKFKYDDAKAKEKRILQDVGPSWYIELSNPQKELLTKLRELIRTDLIDDYPVRVRRALVDFGFTGKLPTQMLMNAMRESTEDPVVFMWTLYKELYKVPPSEPRADYDDDAMLIMSALVSLDLENCLQKLEDLTKSKTPPEKQKEEQKVKKPKTPGTKFNEYLQTTNIPAFEAKKIESQKPPPLELKVKLKSDESYEKLRNDDNFLLKRKSINKREQEVDRTISYDFWEPPNTLRNNDPKMAAYLTNLKMMKLKPKIKFIAPFENIQYEVGNVAFTGGKPQYILNGVSVLPSGYIPINGGMRVVNGDMVKQIDGSWKYPRDVRNACESECDCLDKWGEAVNTYLEDSKCRCGHRYDFYNVGKVKEKYFCPPTRHGKHWFDKAKIYQMDDREDFIKDNFKDALSSKVVTPEPSEPTVIPAGLQEKELVEAFLSELNNTPLVIPHLPEANLLKSLQEWVRTRVKGPMTAAQKKKQLLKSQRRWMDLKRLSFVALPYRIPLKEQQLMTWDQRKMTQEIFEQLLQDYKLRNQKCMIYQAQLWWATMKDEDPSTSNLFRDVFFAYMPARKKDITVINPYNPRITQARRHGKGCSLER